MAAISNDDSWAPQSSLSVFLFSPVPQTGSGDYEWLFDMPRQLNRQSHHVHLLTHLSLAAPWQIWKKLPLHFQRGNALL